MRSPLLCLLLACLALPAGAAAIPACEGSMLCVAGESSLIRLDIVALAAAPPVLLPTPSAAYGRGAEEPSPLRRLFCTLLSSSAACADPLQLVEDSSSTWPEADSSRSLIGICPKACVEQLRQGS